MLRFAKLTVLVVLVAVVGTSVEARSSGRRSSTESRQTLDQTFVQKAAAGGLAEVQLGQLASAQGGSPTVRQFGQRMIQDHTLANQQLEAAAQQAKISVPQSIDAKHAAVAEQLTAEKGAAFDLSYAQQMVQDHRQTVALFERAAAEAADPTLRQYAQQQLPTLREHLQLAMAMAGITPTAQYGHEPAASYEQAPAYEQRRGNGGGYVSYGAMGGYPGPLTVPFYGDYYTGNYGYPTSYYTGNYTGSYCAPSYTGGNFWYTPQYSGQQCCGSYGWSGWCGLNWGCNSGCTSWCW